MDSSVSQSFPLAAVAVDKDKSSQGALKWALDNVAVKGQTLILIHVNTHGASRKLFCLNCLSSLERD